MGQDGVTTTNDRLPFFSKNIFIFCDGTWCGDHTGTRTNIQLLYEFVRFRCGADPERCLYFSGVGLGGSELDYLASGPLALDIKAKCVEVYEHIVKAFTPGDKVWLFGLSRGAFTVRRVAGMIHNLGILRFDEYNHHQRCEVVFDMFTNGSEQWRPNAPASQEFKRTHCHVIDPDDPSIHFMGLFDTVGAEGVPTKLGEHCPYGFYDKLVSRSVKNVYQCAAIHDRLLFFQPCSIGRDPSKNFEGFHTQELWVPGCHYDVGRQHFKFGAGFWTLLVAKMQSRRRFLIPEILPNHNYADKALDRILGKMIEEGFPSLDHWPVLDNVKDPTNPPAEGMSWDGDVYDKLIDHYHLTVLKSWIVGERLLPREPMMAQFVHDSAKYPSRAVENHRFLYPSATLPVQIEIKQFHLARRIPPKSPPTMEEIMEVVVRAPIEATDHAVTGALGFLSETAHNTLMSFANIVVSIARAPSSLGWH